MVVVVFAFVEVVLLLFEESAWIKATSDSDRNIVCRILNFILKVEIEKKKRFTICKDDTNFENYYYDENVKFY